MPTLIITAFQINENLQYEGKRYIVKAIQTHIDRRNPQENSVYYSIREASNPFDQGRLVSEKVLMKWNDVKFAEIEEMMNVINEYRKTSSHLQEYLDSVCISTAATRQSPPPPSKL